MARQTGTRTGTRGRAGFASQGGLPPEEIDRMIQEAAYFHFVERGYEPGHEIEDWLAAEAEVGGRITEKEPEEILEFEVQQRGTLSPREDEALKRMVKQHPTRDIPQVESVEPGEAPLKE